MASIVPAGSGGHRRPGVRAASAADHLEATARTTVAAALLAQGRAADAEIEIGRAIELGHEDEELAHQLWTAMVRARVLAATGRADEGLAALEAGLARARTAGFVDLALEAELTLADVTGDARRRRSAIAEARRTGFRLFARERPR